MNTIGLAAVLGAFQEASMFYTMTNGYFGEKNKRIATKALAFIQGTGLDITIRAYGLNYDADQLRSVFYQTFHVKANT